MGVNMPARTVVFDSIRKHDGTKLRDLLPGEYIQMAGRAGRRGLDTTGTVILLCKGDVPEMSDLHKMMLVGPYATELVIHTFIFAFSLSQGKPTILHSQFRLTYSMILNPLRVEQLRVEDMMKRSFSEFHSQRDAGKRKEALEVLTDQVNNMQEVVDFTGDLHTYYVACNEYFKLREYIQRVLLSHPLALKALSPGRVIVLNNDDYRNAAALVLKAEAGGKEKSFSVLVLTGEKDEEERDNLMPRPVDLRLFRPMGACGQTVVTVKGEDISSITNKMCRISADKIIDDHKKRQIPRFRSVDASLYMCWIISLPCFFRNDPPSQSTTTAAQELLRIVESNSEGLQSLDPINDLHIRDVDLVQDFQRLKFLESSFQNYECMHEPNFTENVRTQIYKY
jgi:antiviral helicase SKI2